MKKTTVEREIDGTTYIIKLHRDKKHPEKNRFNFEGEKYSLIIRTPKSVSGSPVESKPNLFENVEEILETVREIKEKLEAT